MSELLILSIAGVGVWSLRASAIILVGGRTLPDDATLALGYAKHAVLAAMIGAAVTSGQNFQGGWPGALIEPSPLLGAAFVAGAVAWRSAGLLRTLVAGMATAAALSAWPL